MLAILGYECKCINPIEEPGRRVWQFTVDVMEDDEIFRHTLVGSRYSKAVRMQHEVAEVVPGGEAVARKLDELDREAGRQIGVVMERLTTAQRAVIERARDPRPANGEPA